MFKSFKLQKEKGQGLVEYSLILVLVAVVVIAVLALLGPSIANIFNNVLSNMQNGGAASAPQPTATATTIVLAANPNIFIVSVTRNGPNTMTVVVRITGYGGSTITLTDSQGATPQTNTCGTPASPQCSAYIPVGGPTPGIVTVTSPTIPGGSTQTNYPSWP